jgi:hypothetical protein
MLMIAYCSIYLMTPLNDPNLTVASIKQDLDGLLLSL